MNLSSSFKKIICFLLAVLMLLSAVGCKDDSSSKKKKVVIKKKVIVKTNDNENDNFTGKEFINGISPKYSIISVGKNNWNYNLQT